MTELDLIGGARRKSRKTGSKRRSRKTSRKGSRKSSRRRSRKTGSKRRTSYAKVSTKTLEKLLAKRYADAASKGRVVGIPKGPIPGLAAVIGDKNDDYYGFTRFAEDRAGYTPITSTYTDAQRRAAGISTGIGTAALDTQGLFATPAVIKGFGDADPVAAAVKAPVQAAQAAANGTRKLLTNGVAGGTEAAPVEGGSETAPATAAGETASPAAPAEPATVSGGSDDKLEL